jgi:hypothetical protein
MNTDSLRALLARLKGSRAAQVAVLLVVVLLGGGTISLVVDDDGPGPAPPHTVKILTSTVDSADAGRAPDVALKAPALVVAQVQKNSESDLRAESPTPANSAAQDKAAASDQLPVVTPAAAPSQRGCTSRFVQNYSSRRGVAPRVITLHETVSNDIPGWADVNAIGVWFNNPASQASSNYTIDREGHCLYLVRESDKAWAQASANPWVVSFEIINPAARVHGVHNLIDGPGRKRLIEIINDVSKRWDIPLRRARNSGCVVTSPGINDHTSWGQCGGGHVDVGPFRNAIDPIISDARKLCEKRYRAAHKPVPARCRA